MGEGKGRRGGGWMQSSALRTPRNTTAPSGESGTGAGGKGPGAEGGRAGERAIRGRLFSSLNHPQEQVAKEKAAKSRALKVVSGGRVGMARSEEAGLGMGGVDFRKRS